MDHYFPDIKRKDYIKFFERVVVQSASLVSQWMACGFTHGVLNTDNMSLLSITIDYGPFGFLDSFNASFVPNHSDDEGRYSFGNQPKIFKWNLERLADALDPLFTDSERVVAADIVARFDKIYKERFLANLRRKLGFTEPQKEDAKVIQLLLDIMQDQRADFTQTFRQLGQIDLNNIEISESSHWALHPLTIHSKFTEFIESYRNIIKEAGISEEQRHTLMENTNPQYVLRNWMAEAAIRQAEQDDFYLTNLLLKILRNPYKKDDEADSMGFSSPPPNWACSLRVSCSS